MPRRCDEWHVWQPASKQPHLARLEWAAVDNETVSAGDGVSVHEASGRAKLPSAATADAAMTASEQPPYRGRHRGRHSVPGCSRRWRWALAPWLVVCLVATTLAVTGAAAYGWLLREATCRGEALTVQLVAGPDQYLVLDELAQQWQRRTTEVAGTCPTVAVSRRDAADVSGALRTAWPASAGPRPDVWVPDSRAWIRTAAARPEAAALLPDGDVPSVASSPVVLAAPTPMVQALQSVGAPSTMQQLIATFGSDASWAIAGHPEWGQLQLGQLDPRRATPALHLLLGAADPAGDSGVADVTSALAPEAYIAQYRPATEGFVAELAERDASQLADAPIFPALERDLALFNALDPATSLTPIYPAATPAADYPYVVLKADWVTSKKQAAAREFLDFVKSEAAQPVFSAASFRDSKGAAHGAKYLDPAVGFAAQPAAPVSTLPPSEIHRVLTAWSTDRGPVAEASIATATN